MAEDNSSLHIDTDWKKQAQEEKRRLAEQQKQAPPQPAAAAPAGTATGGVAADAAARSSRELPPASFATLVQSIVTQALFYLGELAPRGGEPAVNLDMAKHHIDTLGVLEEMTANNLTPDEKHMLDAALYETRMRYVNVASQFVS